MSSEALNMSSETLNNVPRDTEYVVYDTNSMRCMLETDDQSTEKTCVVHCTKFLQKFIKAIPSFETDLDMVVNDSVSLNYSNKLHVYNQRMIVIIDILACVNQ